MSNSGCKESVRRALLIFMRYPEAGQVKSRLAAGMGAEKAARVYEIMVRRTLGVLTDFKRCNPDVNLFISFTPSDKKDFLQREYPGPWTFIPQEGGHLGDRMDRALQRVFARGFQHVVLVGTDLAHPDVETYEEAFHALKKGFTPLGPAADGGFYLLGSHGPCSAAFQWEDWGTAAVYGRTEEALIRSGCRVLKLHEKQDVDRPEDFELLQDHFFFKESLSVIVPTIRSPGGIAPLLDHLESRLWPGDEIIVAGTEPNDATQWRINGTRVRFIASPRGRGLQLNKGAGAAKGSLFLFLHDDCIPPDQFAYHVRKIAQGNTMSLGCFQLAFAPSAPSLDLISGWANLRTDLLDLPYGDQGFFCRRDTFLKVRGFKNPFLMEDVDFALQCKKWGRLLKIRESVHASSQRYLKRGVLRASLQNHFITLLYSLGVSNRRLYEIYYGMDPSENGKEKAEGTLGAFRHSCRPRENA